MLLRFGVLAFCALPAVLALPFGVYWTAMGIGDSITDRTAFASRLWRGVPLLVAGLILPELFWRYLARLASDPQELERLANGDERERKGLEQLVQVAPTLLTIALILLQFITLMQFLLMLDMHVRFRAAAGIYGVYVAGVMVLVGVRWKQWTYAERLYVRWGWAIVLALGVPLLAPTIRKMGLMGPLF